MSELNLVLIAGCNGSGKSTYSNNFLPADLSAFDADKRKKDIYDSFSFDFEFREQMAWNQTQQEFETTVHRHIDQKRDFAYETNFNDSPFHWAEKFQNAGYRLNLLFFTLQSVEKAIERVAIRYQHGGHYVQDSEVAARYIAGFKNLELYFFKFDSVAVFEASIENEAPKTLFVYERGCPPQIISNLPAYFKKNCPSISKFVTTS